MRIKKISASLIIVIFISVLISSVVFAQTASYYVRYGYERLNHGDYLGAMASFNKAIEINPRYADASVGRGNTIPHLEAWVSRTFQITVEKSNGKTRDYMEAARLGHAGARRWLLNAKGIHTEREDIYIEKDEYYTGEERSHTEEKGGNMTPPPEVRSARTVAKNVVSISEIDVCNPRKVQIKNNI